MGVSAMDSRGSDLESEAKLLPSSIIPEDNFHLAYIIHFILGTSILFPWSTFITAIDYFNLIYPDTSVNRIFAVVYMFVALLGLLFITFHTRHVSNTFTRINVGLAFFLVSLLSVPIIDTVYIRGRVGLYHGFYVTVLAVALSAIGDALMQSSLFGVAGELPERYMQAAVAGTAGSGVLVPILRALTKVVYGDDENGLRSGAVLYFYVGVALMAITIILYNIARRLPVMKYYADSKRQAVETSLAHGSNWEFTFLEVVMKIKWFVIGLFLVYFVTLSIYPGYITEDVSSALLRDWYPILLIFGYNLFDLVGKSLTSLYRLDNAWVAITGCVFRLLFYPLCILCLHGPEVLRTEIPVTLLTCLLGLTNGYFTSVLMIMAPKTVSLIHAETVGMGMVLFIYIGLASGSVLAWLWVI